MHIFFWPYPIIFQSPEVLCTILSIRQPLPRIMSDVYVVIHLGSTLDDSFSYRDTCELLTLSWCTVQASTLQTLLTQTLILKPESSPVTPACLAKYNVTWDDVKAGFSFKDAIAEFDRRLTEEVRGQEFSFVTFDISLLRVLLPREARDKGVVMPVYLQHPRVFDLGNEYLKWQATHPEAMSYPNSSISNVITALDATTPSGWSEDEQDDIAKSIEVYAAILVQLVKKSVPLEAHLLVLTRPYDSAQDAKAFLAERSKILFLSNLPAETTQSELELWFAQYGSRPIAFWTLKNGENDLKNNQNTVPNKSKSICGFAVFSKHEQAAESLYLNGRMLIDRIVEVLASSTRILDKASDLLTPFASLKNRPRPGDWNCPSCGFSNFQRRIACFRCSFPASSAVAIQEQMYGGPLNNNHDSTLIRRHKPDEKQNLSGNAGNGDFYMNNAHHQLKNNNNNNGYSNNYTHNYSQVHNNGNVQRTSYSNSVPFRAGDWKCTNEACNYHNFAKNLCCLKCGGAKPASQVTQMQNSASNNISSNGSVNQANIHTVNTTAAAIAAATASGQPLNISNNYGSGPRTQTNRLPVQGSLQAQSHIPMQLTNNGLYSNLGQLQQLQFKQQQQQQQQLQQQQQNLQVPSHLPQHLALLQGQGQPKPRQRTVSANNSPHLYGKAPELQFKDKAGGISMLNSQINSLSLNNSTV